MILGVILRNYKSYRGWNYVELTNGDYFTGIIGDNGAGKSSILEALDVFFNKPKSEWNYNNSINKNGFENREPEICPVFLLEKKKINKQRNIYKSLEILEADKNQLHSSHAKLFSKIFNQIQIISNNEIIDLNNHFILPIGFKRENKTTTNKSFSFLE